MLWRILTPCVRRIGDDSGVGVDDVVGVEVEGENGSKSFVYQAKLGCLSASTTRQLHISSCSRLSILSIDQSAS